MFDYQPRSDVSSKDIFERHIKAYIDDPARSVETLQRLVTPHLISTLQRRDPRILQAVQPFDVTFAGTEPEFPFLVRTTMRHAFVYVRKGMERDKIANFCRAMRKRQPLGSSLRIVPV